MPSCKSRTRAFCHKDTPSVGRGFTSEPGPHCCPKSGSGAHRAEGHGGPQAPSSGGAHLGHLAASLAERPGDIKLQGSFQATAWALPGEARRCPLTSPWAVGSEEPVFELGSPSPPAGPQGWPGERPWQQSRELPRPRSEEIPVLKAAPWRALSMLPRPQGLAATHPCPRPARPQSLQGTASCRGPSTWAPAATFFAWTRLCFCRREAELFTQTPRLLLPVRVPEKGERRGLRVDHSLQAGRAHAQATTGPANTLRTSPCRAPGGERAPSLLRPHGACPPVTQTPRPTAGVGTGEGLEAGRSISGSLSAVSGSEAGAPAPLGLSAVFPGERPTGQRGFVSMKLLAEGAG